MLWWFIGWVEQRNKNEGYLRMLLLVLDPRGSIHFRYCTVARESAWGLRGSRVRRYFKCYLATTPSYAGTRTNN